MLQLPEATRAALWDALVRRIERYQREVDGLRVAPHLDPAAIREWLAACDFSVPEDPIRALNAAADALTRWQVHTPHPRYFGLFNPCPTTMGIAADTLVATFNPQIAAWSHSPFAAEVETHLVRVL